MQTEGYRQFVYGQVTFYEEFENLSDTSHIFPLFNNNEIVYTICNYFCVISCNLFTHIDFKLGVLFLTQILQRHFM
jgi:hypothetical protein